MKFTNTFKEALRSGSPQIGLWLGLGSAPVAEICACSGADWLLIDGEHGLNDARSTLAQLHAVQGAGAHPVARISSVRGDSGPLTVKEMLDIGVQTLMVPMVETAAQAQGIVRTTRYAPEGARGMAISRATRWSQWDGYVAQANGQICLIAQIETVQGLRNLEQIAAVDGIDGIFIGAADLAMDMGHAGDSSQPAVRAEVLSAIRRIAACGKAPGAMSLYDPIASEYLAAGAAFLAVGFDGGMLARHTIGLVQRFHGLAQELARERARA